MRTALTQVGFGQVRDEGMNMGALTKESSVFLLSQNSVPEEETEQRVYTFA